MAKTSMVAIIGVDASVRPVMEQVVKSLGVEAVYFKSSGEFIGSGHVSDAMCLVLDAHISGMGAPELQSHLASSGRYIPMILITASEDINAREEAFRLGALDIVKKPGSLVREVLKAFNYGGSDKRR